MTDDEIRQVCRAAVEHERRDITNGMKLVQQSPRDDIEDAIKRAMNGEPLNPTDQFIVSTFAIVGFTAVVQGYARDTDINPGDAGRK